MLNLIHSILQLQVQEFFNRSYGSLSIFSPASPVVTEIFCGIGVSEFVSIFSNENLCLTNVGIVIRLQTGTCEISIVFIRVNIAVLLFHLFIKLHSAAPNDSKFLIIQRRITAFCMLQKGFMGLVGITIALQHSTGKAAHGVVSTASRNHFIIRRFCFAISVRRDFLINSDPAIMPNHFTGIRAINKACCIQSIIIEERICRMDGFFQICVLLCIADFTDWEIHMATRTWSKTFLI